MTFFSSFDTHRSLLVAVACTVATRPCSCQCQTARVTRCDLFFARPCADGILIVVLRVTTLTFLSRRHEAYYGIASQDLLPSSWDLRDGGDDDDDRCVLLMGLFFYYVIYSLKHHHHSTTHHAEPSVLPGQLCRRCASLPL